LNAFIAFPAAFGLHTFDNRNAVRTKTSASRINRDYLLDDLYKLRNRSSAAREILNIRASLLRSRARRKPEFAEPNSRPC
jgi:hypothetical protein